MQVYIVQCEYSTEDEREVKLHVFDTFDKAYQKFQALIKEEMNPDLSWIGQLDWIDGQPPKEYEFLNNETNNENESQYWYVINTDDVLYHTYFDLLIKRVL